MLLDLNLATFFAELGGFEGDKHGKSERHGRRKLLTNDTAEAFRGRHFTRAGARRGPRSTPTGQGSPQPISLLTGLCGALAGS